MYARYFCDGGKVRILCSQIIYKLVVDFNSHKLYS